MAHVVCAPVELAIPTAIWTRGRRGHRPGSGKEKDMEQGKLQTILEANLSLGSITC